MNPNTVNKHAHINTFVVLVLINGTFGWSMYRNAFHSPFPLFPIAHHKHMFGKTRNIELFFVVNLYFQNYVQTS